MEMKTWLFVYLLPMSGVFGALLLGGYRPVNINDPIIQSQLRPVLESKGQLGSLPIKSVEQQRLYKVTNFKVYQGIPNNDQDTCVKITCHAGGVCEGPQPCERRTHQTKAHLLGGQEVVQRADIRMAEQFAVDHLNSMSNSVYRAVAEDVSNITSQVVNGMMYRFTLSLVTTGCRNSESNKGKQLGDCKLTDTSERQQCRVSVWVKPGGKYSLDSKQCGQMQKQSENTMLGGDGHDYCHVHLKAFHTFKDTYNKSYGINEAYRFQTFCENMKRIQVLRDNEKGSAVYGVTKFADLSENEFRKLYLTPIWDQSTPRPWMTSAGPANPNNEDVPDSFDWRDHGAVTAVKNQGSCGSCWAFSTTGNIEGQWAIKSGKLVSLSEQELVDCDKLDEGCNGGLPSNAYQAIMKLGGLETEKKYSYKGEDEKCQFSRKEVAVKINAGLNISADENEMKAWLYKNGPISIGINAFAMQFYWGGVSHPWKIFCNPDSLDHGVLIVGYGVTSSNEPYWIVKNSWGPDWGEKGYYLVYRGSGVCGLNRMCTSAVIN